LKTNRRDVLNADRLANNKEDNASSNVFLSLNDSLY
jgi:hypothetical protein